MKRSILALSSLFLVGTLSAEWQEIADFDDGIVIRDPNLPADTTDWEYEGWQYTQNNTSAELGVLSAVADPTGQLEGLVMESTPGVGGAGSNANVITLNIPPEMQIVDDLNNPHLQTFYFKMMKPLVDGVPGQMNTTVGLMSRGAWRAANAALLPADPLLPEHFENDLGEGEDPRYETQRPSWGQYSLIARYMTHGSIDLRDAGNYVHLSSTEYGNVGAPQIANAWYELWFVIDHSNINNEDPFRQRAAVYIKGGPDYPEQTLVSVEYTVAGEGENPDTTYFAGGGANYRVETFEPLDMIILINNAGNQGSLEQLDPIYLDDFYVDLTGENLTSAGSAPAEYNPFTAPVDLGDGDAAVDTSGFTLEAINIQATGSTPANHMVNGVNFMAATESGGAIVSPAGHIMVTGFTAVAGGNDNAAAPFSSASAGMQGILTDAVSGTGAYALTLQDLEVGVTYMVQILTNNSGAATGVTTIGDGEFMRDLEVNTTGAAGGMGQTTTFSFTADAASKSFGISGSSAQVNAVQLRKLTGGVPSDAVMVNVSSRAPLAAGQTLTPGFVVTGTEPKTVLLRAMGPTLADFGITTFCENPSLELFQNVGGVNTSLMTNSNWYEADNKQAIDDASVQVGAWAFGGSSMDSAILMTLDPGVYTAAATCEAEGDVVAEVYLVD